MTEQRKCPACGSEGGCLHGIPEIIGTSEDFPLTSRSEYLGIDRSSYLTRDEVAFAARVDVLEMTLRQWDEHAARDDSQAPYRGMELAEAARALIRAILRGGQA